MERKIEGVGVNRISLKQPEVRAVKETRLPKEKSKRSPRALWAANH